MTRKADPKCGTCVGCGNTAPECTCCECGEIMCDCCEGTYCAGCGCGICDDCEEFLCQCDCPCDEEEMIEPTKDSTKDGMTIEVGTAFNVTPEAIAVLKEKTGYTEEQIQEELEHRFQIILDTYIEEHTFVTLEENPSTKGRWFMYPATEDEVEEGGWADLPCVKVQEV